jgi:hypothetical protein
MPNRPMPKEFKKESIEINVGSISCAISKVVS